MTRDLCAFGMEVFSGNAMKRILTKILTICALPLLLIACWQLGSMGHWWGSYIVPPPERVWSSWLQLAASGQLARHIGASLMRVMTGFAIAAALALPCGIWLGLHPAARRVCHSLLEFLRNVPPLALLPMLILWFGIGEASKIIIVVLATFFPIFLNTLDGMSHPDEQLLEMGRVYGLSSRGCFSGISACLRPCLPCTRDCASAWGYSWRSLIGAEMIAAAAGLGYLILDGEEMARPDIVVAGILTLGVLGIAADALMRAIGRRYLWTERKEHHE